MPQHHKTPTNSRNKVDLSPKRKIGLTRRSVSGIYVFRGETAIPHESTLERDFLVRNEFLLEVLQILPQPIRIPFMGSNGRTYSYTPDFLVTYRPTGQGCRKPLLVEVKPNDQWRRNWRKWRMKWEAAIRCAKGHGWAFRIHDESRIRDTVLHNVRSLDPFKRMRFDAEVSQRIIEMVRLNGPTPVSTILDQYCSDTSPRHAIALLWHLVAVRKLDCNITGLLDQRSELWVPHDE